MGAAGEEPDEDERTPDPPKRWKLALTIFLMFAIPAGTALISLLDSGPEGPPAPPAVSVSGTPPPR